MQWPKGVEASYRPDFSRIIDALHTLSYAVPGDVSVAGFGNAADPLMRLTTVDARVDHVVAEAVDWILSARAPESRVFMPYLVVRDST